MPTTVHSCTWAFCQQAEAATAADVTGALAGTIWAPCPLHPAWSYTICALSLYQSKCDSKRTSNARNLWIVQNGGLVLQLQAYSES